MMRYWPVASVTAVRTFSISALLVASTVTPGITAPDGSLTTPVMEAWADATAGSSRNAYADLRMMGLLPRPRDGRGCVRHVRRAAPVGHQQGCAVGYMRWAAG